ncbi:hypothetical protein [Streptomyces chrestomyceticus]|uniref:hypothetical protein n=1 Tax=Streptomyces chrestomyceticus TaxID=68185 RepID=UPI0037BBC99E
MPLRIMMWNIQNLGLGKMTATSDDPHLRRLDYIVDSVIRCDPGIFVVLEVSTEDLHLKVSGLQFGAVISAGSGAVAVLEILGHLRVRTGRDWRLVPPLISGAEGRKEGVAVFFDNGRVNFRGPLQLDEFPADAGRTIQRAGGLGGAAATYRAPWADALPATVPTGPPIGGGLRQNQLAGHTYFETPGGNTPLCFPRPEHRSPLLTRFQEVGNQQRVFTVLSAHLPPEPNWAREAVREIMRIPPVTADLAANEVRVILGDLNLNALDPRQVHSLNPVISRPVRRTGAGATHFERFHFLDPTMLRSTDQASLGGTAPYLDYLTPFSYPGGPTGWKALDHIFAAYGANAGYTPPPGFGQGYVLDRVAGTPLNPAPGFTPLPPLPPPAVQRSVPALQTLPPAQRDEQFRRIHNFGKIRGASDHMAVFADL